MSLGSKTVLCISRKYDISAVVHLDAALVTNTQHRTDLVRITGRLRTGATCSYTQQDLSCAERACWQLQIPLWLESNNRFLGTSHCFSVSSSSELPTSSRYHHLFTATPAHYGSTDTSARCEWIGIEQNDGRCIPSGTHWDPTAMGTPLCPLRCCESRHRKYDPGRTVNY